MGALAEQANDETTPPEGGHGARLLHWWRDIADDEDRATLRRWAETPPSYGGKGAREIAERLTASGFPISLSTVQAGIRTLKAKRWEL